MGASPSSVVTNGFRFSSTLLVTSGYGIGAAKIVVWGAPYNADFTKLLIRQLIAIVQRDQRAALDWVGGVNVLPSIVSYQLAPLTQPIFPALMLYPLSARFSQDTWRALKSEIDLHCAIAVTNADNQTLIEQVQDYVRALDAIFNVLPATNFTDLYTDKTLTLDLPGVIQAPALAQGTVQELFVAEHAYDQIQPMRTEFVVVASLRLRIWRTET